MRHLYLVTIERLVRKLLHELVEGKLLSKYLALLNGKWLIQIEDFELLLIRLWLVWCSKWV